MKFPVLLCLLASPALLAQEASPSASPAASPAPSAVQLKPAPPPSVDTLGSDAVQKATDTLENRSGISPDEKSRALLQGLLDRMSASLTNGGGGTAATAPFYSELYQGSTGYLRPGAFTAPNLEQCEHALKLWSKNNTIAVILDLRGSPGESDFQNAARLAGFFCAKGTTLFMMADGTADHAAPIFTAKEDPVFKGVLIVLVDSSTAQAAETVAAALRHSAKALLVGDPIPGKAFQFNDVPLDGGAVLHMAAAWAVLPGGAAVGGLKPDIAEGLAGADKAKIMQEIDAHGVHAVVAEHGRARLNEAALVAGSDPGIDALEKEQNNKSAPPILDRQLQRALDAVTSISLFEARGDNTPQPAQ